MNVLFLHIYGIQQKPFVFLFVIFYTAEQFKRSELKTFWLEAPSWKPIITESVSLIGRHPNSSSAPYCDFALMLCSAVVFGARRLLADSQKAHALYTIIHGVMNPWMLVMMSVRRQVAASFSITSSKEVSQGSFVSCRPPPLFFLHSSINYFLFACDLSYWLRQCQTFRDVDLYTYKPCKPPGSIQIPLSLTYLY